VLEERKRRKRRKITLKKMYNKYTMVSMACFIRNYMIRKLRFYLFLFVLLSPLLLKGQSFIGIQGGTNSSKFYTTGTSTPHYSDKFDSPTSCIFGVTYKQRKDQAIHLSVNFDYLYRNFNADITSGGLGGSTSSDLEVDIHSLNLRVLPEMRVGKNIGFYFNIGPYFGVIVNSQKTESWETVIYSGETYTGYESGNSMAEFNGLDIGISSSLGLEIPLAGKILIIPEVNWGVGLTNLGADYFDGYVDKFNSINLQLTLGVAYRLD
jgi:hypothetical protein